MIIGKKCVALNKRTGAVVAGTPLILTDDELIDIAASMGAVTLNQRNECAKAIGLGTVPLTDAEHYELYKTFFNETMGGKL